VPDAVPEVVPTQFLGTREQPRAQPRNRGRNKVALNLSRAFQPRQSRPNLPRRHYHFPKVLALFRVVLNLWFPFPVGNTGFREVHEYLRCALGLDAS
jgi:hypothetical protein